MKKKFLSILLALTMCLTLLPTTALAGKQQHMDGGNVLERWSGAIYLPTASAYYLQGNVKLTQNWKIENNNTVTLCLNGKVLDLNTYHIEVDTGATLNLYDCGNDTHYFEVVTDGLWKLTNDDTANVITGGVITGGNSSSDGGAVLVKGTFNMYGGNITGNTAYYGGGVYVKESATFVMTGGTVTGNTADNGGGVYVVDDDTSFFTMTGGTITGNTATDNGGGVYVSDGSETCLAAGTMITMADGSQKPVEALQKGDEIRTFDHDTGLASQAKICFFWHYDQPRTGAFTLHFSNDIDVTVVGGHSFYEREENKYITVYADDAEAYIGHSFYNLEAKRWETLESVTFINEPVETYIVATEKHLNCVAEGMLTCEDDVYTAFMNVFAFDKNMKVDAEKKAADIDRWGTWAWDEALGCPQNVFDAHNLQYAPIAIGKGLVTLAYIKEVIAACAPLYEQAAAAEKSQPAPMLRSAVRQCVDEAGETYFVATATSVQNSYHDTPGVYLGGTAQITGNTVNSTTNNLYLPNNQTVTISTTTNPTTGFSVGVTTENPPTNPGTVMEIPVEIAETEEDYTAYFFSDNPVYAVTHKEDALKLIKSWTPLKGVLNPQSEQEMQAATNGIPGLFEISGDTNKTIKLLTDFQADTNDTTLTVNDTKTLDLNGHVIDGKINASTSVGSVITVPSSAKLTLTDRSTGKYTYFNYVKDGAWTLNTTADADDEAAAIEIADINNETATDTLIKLPGGVITGGNIDFMGDGGGMNIANGGSFTMTGGNIVGNKAFPVTRGYGGGGVYVTSGGTFTMSGGNIIGNAAKDGGGVYVRYDTFTMTDGTISNNTAANDGGGVYVVVDESAKDYVTLGGKAKITGNTAGSPTKSANNLYLNGAFVTISSAPAPTTMSVGVTMANDTGAFTTNGTAGQVGFFHADNGSYYVKHTGTETPHLELATKGENVYQITVDTKITNGTVTVSDYACKDDTVTVTVTPASGYQLKADSLTYKIGDDTTPYTINKDTDTYSFTMPAANVTVTAAFVNVPTPPAPTPPSGGGSTPTVTVPVTGESSKVNVQASVSGSTATVKEIKAEDLAKVTGGESVEIDLTGLKKNIDTAKIPTTTVEKIAEQSGMSVKLSTATVTFDTAATQEIAAQADGKTIELVVDDIKNVSLNAVQKEAVGKLDTALIIDAYLVSGGERLCSESKGGFGGGKATVALPFEIKNNRTAANYSVFYVDDAGNLERLAAKYDAKLGAFVFDIEHFSNYVVAYDENGGYANCPKDATCVYARFTDADTAAWYHDGVHYCVENGMMNGVSDTQFAPSGTLTRGMVVTVLARLNGVEAGTGNEWYVPGQKWAMANGISDGTNMTANITREELATMLYRYALLKKVDVEKFTENTNTLSHNDVFTVSDWATSGMHFCIAAGVVGGDDKGNLNPHSTATRAEAAAMFQRFSEKVTK